MTETPETQPTDSEYLASIADDTAYIQPDPLLVGLVFAVHNDRELELPLTVTVGGTTISGLLVNRHRWIDAMTALGANIFDEVRKSWATEDEELAASGDDTVPKFGYFSLIEAQIVSTSGVLPTEGMPYRGRLTGVQGWSFGRLQVG